MRDWRGAATLLVIVALVAAISTISTSVVLSQQTRPTRNRVLEYNARVALGQIRAVPKRQLVSGGVLFTYLEATGRPTRAAARVPRLPRLSHTGTTRPSDGCPNVFTSGFGWGTQNTRVNQDCSLRRQAEEFIAINPTNPNNLIAGQNDSVTGFNHCGIDFSFDRGRTWGTMVPPWWQFIGGVPAGSGTTFDAASDPAVTFDSQGNAYFTCVLFMINTAQSAILVTKSNAAFGGSFFHSPAPGPFQTFNTLPLGVVANDNNPNIFHDKEFINADRGASSPKKDNVYVTWTRFNIATGAGVLQNSPIFFSQSTDGGATWSAGIEISGANAAICTAFSGSTNPFACDQDQGSWPTVGPDGTIYVVFGNGNTPLLGINQVLAVKCPGTANCAVASNWTPPVKVADLIGTHPLGPAPATGCPAFRQCLPPNGYRVPEFTSMSGAVDPTNPSRVFVVLADTRNIGTNCDWDGGTAGSAVTATPPCDNDVFMVVSTDGGLTWGAAINVSDLAGNDNASAQWQPWSAVHPNGKLSIAYYDRKYNTCETTGCQDITLAQTTNAGVSFTYTRITTASMPNLVPSNNPAQAGFLGDYMGIDADGQGVVIVWADTRGRNGTVEEDIYITRAP